MVLGPGLIGDDADDDVIHSPLHNLILVATAGLAQPEKKTGDDLALTAGQMQQRVPPAVHATSAAATPGRTGTAQAPASPRRGFHSGQTEPGSSAASSAPPGPSRRDDRADLAHRGSPERHSQNGRAGRVPGDRARPCSRPPCNCTGSSPGRRTPFRSAAGFPRQQLPPSPECSAGSAAARLLAGPGCPGNRGSRACSAGNRAAPAGARPTGAPAAGECPCSPAARFP